MPTTTKKIKSVEVIRPGSAPDIDTDFHTVGREEVVDHVAELYGRKNVANIITFGTFKAKNSLKSMATVYEIPFAEANRVAKLIPDPLDGKECTLDDLVDENSPRYAEGEDFRRATASDKWQEVITMARQLQGRIRETGVHACFAPGTMVRTLDGLKPIEDIQINDQVLTHKNRFKPVVDTILNEKQGVYKTFIPNSIPTEVTGNHPFYVRPMSIKNKKRILGAPQWKAVRELTAQDKIGVPVNDKSIIPSLPYDLPVESADFWWLAGRFLGDGWCEDFERTSKRRKVDGTVYRTRTNVANCIICVGKNDPTRDTLIKKVGSLFHYHIVNASTTDKIHITKNRDIFEYFKTFGRGALNKHVNPEILDLPVDLLRAFLDGYLSADGSVNKKTGMRSFSTISKELFLGITAVINKVYHVDVKVQYIKRGKSLFQDREVMCHDRYMGDFFMDRRPKSHFFYENGYLWEPITKIIKTDKVIDTYNLSVLDDNSYTANNMLVHNCGVIISNEELTNTIPTQVTKDGALLTQWTYPQCEALGLIKMDFLGLDTLDVMNNTLENIKNEGQEVPDMRALIHGKMDDKKTFELLQNGETTGIFQLGSSGMRELLERVKPTAFEDIAAVNALYRPGPMNMGSHNQYADRKNQREKVDYISDEFIGTPVEDILKPTFGLVLYQEQCMLIAQHAAGMSSYKADKLRKAMGKKKMKIMDELHPEFIAGIMKNNVSEKSAEILWDTIKQFGQYGFNKSHAVSYGLNAYKTCYLKAHYPAEFMSALIQQKLKDKDKVMNYLDDARHMGLRVGPVDINNSRQVIAPPVTRDKFDILYGFSGVKNVSMELANAIIQERKNSAFSSVGDFVGRVSKVSKLNKTSLSNLALAGAFDSLGVTRRAVCEKAEALLKTTQTNKKQANTLFDLIPDANPTVTEAVDLSIPEYSYTDMIKAEADCIGTYISGSPFGRLGKLSYTLQSSNIRAIEQGKTGIVTVVGAFTIMSPKIHKNGSRSIGLRITDNTGALDLYLSKEIIKSVDKGEEILRRKKLQKEGEEIKPNKSRRGIYLEELLADDSVKPKMPIELNEPYVIKLQVFGGRDSGVRVNVIDFRLIPTAYDGSIPLQLKINTRDQLNKVSQVITQNAGNVYVRVFIPNMGWKFLSKRIAITSESLEALEDIIGYNNILTKGA